MVVGLAVLRIDPHDGRRRPYVHRQLKPLHSAVGELPLPPGLIIHHPHPAVGCVYPVYPPPEPDVRAGQVLEPLLEPDGDHAVAPPRLPPDVAQEVGEDSRGLQVPGEAADTGPGEGLPNHGP